MPRLLPTTLVALCALLLGAIATPRAYAETPPAPPTCMGAATEDALVLGCGVTLPRGVPITFVWANEATPIAAALAPPRLAFHGPVPADTRALNFLTLWQRDEVTGAWQSWSVVPNGPFATLTTLQRGATYTAIATIPLDLSLASLAPVHTSVFAGARIVSIYGHPDVPTMGALGTYPSAEAAAVAVQALAQQYVPLSGDTRVIPALHLIVDVAQADPGYDGTYLGRMSIGTMRTYLEAARAHGELLFLDAQVGWSDPLVEVRRLEPLLREPDVHLALDPEFATLGKNEAPGEAIGYLLPEQVNAVQRYLADLSASAAIPSKVLVLHQFRDDMLHDVDRIERVDGVDLVIDMDGWGSIEQKLAGYQAYARGPHAEYAGFKLFYHWDQPLLTPAQVMALPHPPDYLIYQ